MTKEIEEDEGDNGYEEIMNGREDSDDDDEEITDEERDAPGLVCIECATRFSAPTTINDQCSSCGGELIEQE
jgi:hypothetical protein